VIERLPAVVVGDVDDDDTPLQGSFDPREHLLQPIGLEELDVGADQHEEDSITQPLVLRGSTSQA